ncbi:MAG: 5-(carboxyamino)imidazole ribonucleotide synthase [Myxococcota bacterium]|nr:5-(carboxyamino)imidazole ribonucleotide synthase [Myxococcota bacterium]
MTRVGILGGGQLGRMLAARASSLGLDVLVVDPDAGCCAGAVAPVLGRPYDHPDVASALRECDVVTYEFEGVPLDVVRRVEADVPVHPGSRALEVVQDRLAEKRFLRGLGIPTAPFRAVSSERELRRAVAELGLPAVLKTRFDGYDGKGQRLLARDADVAAAWRSLQDHPLILEGFVPFDRELSLIGVRSAQGSWRHWAPSENAHVEGVLRIARSPAPSVGARELARGRDWLERIGRALDYTGVLTVEFFAIGDRWVANEMACRVHNSGHWTIEGAATSQFENHLRAVAGLPLGSADSRGASGMVNLVGVAPDRQGVLSVERAQLHWYGKAVRPGRKLGHVTVQAPDARACEASLQSLVARLGDPKLSAACESAAEGIGRRAAAGGLRTPPCRSGLRSFDGSRSGVAGERSS